jgi:hypothetical protein
MSAPASVPGSMVPVENVPAPPASGPGTFS